MMRLQNVLILALTLFSAACKPQSHAAEAKDTKSKNSDAVNPSIPTQPSGAKVKVKSVPFTAASGSDSRSLCAADESILLSCKIVGKNKFASLCASKNASDDSGYVYYVYGTSGQPEFMFPADKSPHARRFKSTHLGFAGNTGGHSYSFENKGWKYIFYSISGSYGLEDQGVMVIAADASFSTKAETVQPCEKGSVVSSDDEALFKFIRTWDRDAEIDKHGLPSKN